LHLITKEQILLDLYECFLLFDTKNMKMFLFDDRGMNKNYAFKLILYGMSIGLKY